MPSKAFQVHHSSGMNLCGVHLQLVLFFLSLGRFHKGATASALPSLTTATSPTDKSSAYLQHSPSLSVQIQASLDMAYCFQFGYQVHIFIRYIFFILDEVRDSKPIFIQCVVVAASIIPIICPLQLPEKPPELFPEVLIRVVLVGQLQVGIIKHIHIFRGFHKFPSKLVIVLSDQVSYRCIQHSLFYVALHPSILIPIIHILQPFHIFQ